MMILPSPDSSIDLRAVTERPTRGGRKHRLWDRLIEEHHCLRFHGIVGKGPRHVALYGETWLALVGWQPGAFKLAARDRWIGWSQEQQFRPAPGLQQLPFRLPHPRTGAEPGVPRAGPEPAPAVRRHRGRARLPGLPRGRFTGACCRASNWRAAGAAR